MGSEGIEGQHTITRRKSRNASVNLTVAKKGTQEEHTHKMARIARRTYRETKMLALQKAKEVAEALCAALASGANL